MAALPEDLHPVYLAPEEILQGREAAADPLAVGSSSADPHSPE
jgi:hypothetical protein